MANALSANTRQILSMFVLALLLISPIYQLAADPASQSPSPDSDNRLSPAFTGRATSALIAIHQSKQNIADVVTKNLPVGYYKPDLAARAYDLVRQAQIASTTNGDQQAATLLESYFSKVKTWAEQYKASRQSMDATQTMREGMLDDDSVWQAIDSCEKDFNTMLTKRVYTDVASCR